MTPNVFENEGATTSYFTIVTPSYCAQARVLAKSILAVCNPRDITICLVGTRQHKHLFADLKCDVVYAADVVGERTYEDLVTRYSAMEVCCALKPAMAKSLLAKGAQQVIFTDADCEYFSRPYEAERSLSEGAAVLTSPHILRPSDGRHYLDDRALLRSGTYNAGFFAVSASDEGRAFLSWWSERNNTDCTLDDAHGTYYEQKWLDLAHTLFEGIAPIREPGYNLAYWNLYQRTLEQGTDGTWIVDGRPLVFFHYSRWRLSAMTVNDYLDQYIRVPTAQMACRRILEDYASAIDVECSRTGSNQLSTEMEYQHLPDGSPITPIMRRALFRNIKPQEGKYAQRLDVLNSPSPRMPQFPPYTLTNFYEEFWLARADLRNNKFDVVYPDGLRAYTRWLIEVGQAESQIPECLMTPARNALQADIEVVLRRCRDLEAELASLESIKKELTAARETSGELQEQVAILKAQLSTWTEFSKGRGFRLLRGYVRLRSWLTGRPVDVPRS